MLEMISLASKNQIQVLAYSYFPIIAQHSLYNFFSFLFFFFFFNFWPHTQHVEVPGPGIKLETQSDNAGSLTTRPPGNSYIQLL